MENKHKLDNICKITYILYWLFLIYPLQSLIKLGILSTDIRFFEIVSNIEIGYSIEFYAFEFLFLLMLYIGIKSDLKNIEVFEDKEKLKKLKKSTLPYKLFIIVLSMVILIYYLIINFKNIKELMQSIKKFLVMQFQSIAFILFILLEIFNVIMEILYNK